MTIRDHLRHQATHGHPAARATARLLLRETPEPEPEREARDAEVLGWALRSRWGVRVRR